MSFEDVEEDIRLFKIETKKLQEMLKTVGTNNDTDSFRKRLKAQGQETKQCSRKVNQNLKALKESYGGKARLKMSKLTRAFEVVLIEYRRAANELERSERQILKHIQASIPNDSPVGMSSSYEEFNGGLGVPGGGFGARANQHEQVQAQSQMTDISIEFREATIEDMEKKKVAIEEIAKDVQDIQEMFEDLATLVDTQGEMIDDIESNITRAKINVEVGETELVKAEKSQRKARSKQCWILLCVVMILVIIVLVPVLSFT